MKNINFIVIKHPRLDFHGAECVVMDFIEKRLHSSGVKNIIFVNNNDLQKEVKRLSAEFKDDYIAVLNILNPLVDLEIVNQMLTSLNKTEAKVAFCDGAIPGTQVEYILAPGVSTLPNTSERTKDNILVRWFSQDKYNNQFNLYKYKRLKLFLFLVNNIENMHTLSIDSFVARLEIDDIFQKLVSFGENVPLEIHNNCPHCNGILISLPMRMSQEFCGYLPTSRPLYRECESCGLVIMSPCVDYKHTALLYDVFDKQDFVVTLNNPYHKEAPRCNFTSFFSCLPKITRSLDLGGGMGGFSKFLKETYPEWIVTHSDFAIKSNPEMEKESILTRTINFLEEPIGENCYDLITAWEVLEHIPYNKLGFALNNIYKALSPEGVFVFSTPDFDSPLCQSNDFFAACPPFHYLVFGRKWLEQYFKKHNQWDLLSMHSCSDFLDDAAMWYEYANKTAPSFQLRATANILKELLGNQDTTSLANRQLLLDKDMGTEVIVALAKK